jgi:hypothetical protein
MGHAAGTARQVMYKTSINAPGSIIITEDVVALLSQVSTGSVAATGAGGIVEIFGRTMMSTCAQDIHSILIGNILSIYHVRETRKLE